jgi:hypothetical protein
MNVVVTSADIAKGRQGHCGDCPVALAIKRQSGAKKVMVSPNFIYIGPEVFVVPPAVKQWIRNFDDFGARGTDVIHFELTEEA